MFRLQTARSVPLTDDDVSAFFARELEQIKTSTYDIEYPDLTYTENFPISAVGGLGIKSITYRQYDRVGVAKMLASYADDLPRVDIFGDEFTVNVKAMGAAFGYSVIDVEAAAYAGLPLESRKAIDTRDAVERLHNKIAYFGDEASKLLGVLNHPNIPVNDSPDTFDNLSADEMIVVVTAFVASIIEVTKGVERPDTILMPIKQYNIISTTPRSTVSDTTVLEFLLRAMPYIKRISWVQELAGAGEEGADVMIAYTNNPRKLEYQMPAPYQMLAPQQKNLMIDVPTLSTSGGMIVYKPLSASILTGI